MSQAHRVLDQMARQQHGLITRRQLRTCGFTDRQIDGMVGRRLLRRMRRGVYALVGAPASWHQALLAATLCAGEAAVASHSSAARLLSFRYAPDDGLQLTVNRTYPAMLPGVHVHRSVFLGPSDVTRRDGIPCTTFERTLCDETTQLSWLQLSRVLDDGLRRKVTTLERMQECCARLDSGPNRRLSIVQGLLAQRDAAYDPGGSDTELRYLRVLESARLPRPVQQFEVRPVRRTYYLDFAWPDCMVFAEWYGLSWHSGASAVAYDNARLTELSAAGWRPLVFTTESTDAEIVDRTRALLADVGRIRHRRGA
jgi:hypothetical protein